MTEEEKKAVENLDELLGLTVNAYNDESNDESVKKLYGKYVDVYETILNLIEKLQKENEDLNNRDTSRLSEIGELRTKNNYLENEIKYYYIPKDKIREYIKEKEEEKEGVKNISLEEYAITSKELKESEICLLKCILEEK